LVEHTTENRGVPSSILGLAIPPFCLLISGLRVLSPIEEA
jgi:hypothetical protein